MTRRLPIVLAILIAGGAALFLRIHHRESLSATAQEQAQLSAEARSLTSARRTTIPAAPTTEEEPVLSSATASAQYVKPSTPAPESAVPETPESVSLPPATILENMRTSIHQFDSAFGENPVGTNPEITSALHGENPKQIDFLKQDGNRVNAKGELVDGWGTPYFFHQLSAHEMEIRSAGPDKVLYTADDLVIK
jgi:hypothetical protein